MNLLKDFPEDILVQISCAFNLFDTDKDGHLKPKDFLKIFEQVGIKLSEQNKKEMLKSFTPNENETDDISIKDFVSFVNSRMKNVESEEEILEMFKIFDKKGSGKVSINDIRSVLEDDIDEPVSQQELEDLMFTWDKNKDGYLDYQEFKEMMESK